MSIMAHIAWTIGYKYLYRESFKSSRYFKCVQNRYVICIQNVQKHYILLFTIHSVLCCLLSYLSFKDILLLFSHRNGAVRKVAAQSLLAIVEKMGASRIFTQSKEVTEKLLPTTAQFLMDGTPLTRQVIFHFKMKKNIVF